MIWNEPPTIKFPPSVAFVRLTTLVPLTRLVTLICWLAVGSKATQLMKFRGSVLVRLMTPAN